MSSSGFHTNHLAVVGLGLMGSSIALALRNHADKITGIDLDPDTREYAMTQHVADEVTDDLRAGVAEANVVILAMPVRAIVDTLRKRIGSYLRSNTLLLDIGSTKQDICEAMGHLPIGINAIGGHPMAGKENNGITAGEGDLFQGRPFVLCDTRRTTPATRQRAISLAQAIGAIPIPMEAEQHDQIVAAISHLPYILSATLVSTVSEKAKIDDRFWQLAAGGFRDTSRLAASDVNMMGDILSTNAQAVATILAMFRMHLAMLESMLISGDSEHLIESLIPIREARIEWSNKYVK